MRMHDHQDHGRKVLKSSLPRISLVISFGDRKLLDQNFVNVETSGHGHRDPLITHDRYAYCLRSHFCESRRCNGTASSLLQCPWSSQRVPGCSINTSSLGDQWYGGESVSVQQSVCVLLSSRSRLWCFWATHAFLCGLRCTWVLNVL